MYGISYYQQNINSGKPDAKRVRNEPEMSNEKPVCLVLPYIFC